MTLSGSQVVEVYTPSWGKEKGLGVRGFKEEENNSPEDEKSKCLVNRCLPGHADKSFLSLVIAHFLAQKYINYIYILQAIEFCNLLYPLNYVSWPFFSCQYLKCTLFISAVVLFIISIYCIYLTNLLFMDTWIASWLHFKKLREECVLV